MIEFDQVDKDVADAGWWEGNAPGIVGTAESGERRAAMIQDGQKVVAMLVPIDPPLDIAHATGLLQGILESVRQMTER
jgi:hypothetical protein